MCSQSLREFVRDLAADALNEAHVMEWTVEYLQSVYFAPILSLDRCPSLLDSQRCQIRASSHIPYGLNVNLWTSHKLLDYSSPMDPGVVPHESQWNAVANTGSHLLKSFADILCIEAVFSEAPMHNTTKRRDDAEDYHRFRRSPARVLAVRLTLGSPVCVHISIDGAK